MQNQDQNSQTPVIAQQGHASEIHQAGTLASAGRRRTQEQGQGDLDDDRQDATPAAAPEETASQGQANPEPS